MPQGYDGLPDYYLQSANPITPNLGLSLKGMDPIVAEDFVLIDTAFAGVGGSIQVNGAVVNNPNFVNSGTATFNVVGSSISINVVGGGGVFPQTKAAIASNWLNSYDALTGLFTATQPTFADLSSHPTTLAGYGITDAPALPVNSVQFNNNGAFGGSASLTWNKAIPQLFIQTGSLSSPVSERCLLAYSYVDDTTPVPVGASIGVESTTSPFVHGMTALTIFTVVNSASGANGSVHGIEVFPVAVTGAGTCTQWEGFKIDESGIAKSGRDLGYVADNFPISGVHKAIWANNGSQVQFDGPVFIGSLARNTAGTGTGGDAVGGAGTAITLLSSTGSPETNYNAAPGSFFGDITNGDWYIKTAGTGNTGWTQAGGHVVNVLTGYRIANGATTGHVLRGNGTNFVDAALQATDIPALAYISTGLMTTLGDMLYEDAIPGPHRLAGNITVTKMYLSQTGLGATSAAPVWAQVAVGDLANVAGGTVLGNPTTGAASPSATIAPVLGIPGTSTGSIAIASATASGKYTITAPANAATPTLTLPTTSNVLAGQFAGDGVIFNSTLNVASAAGTLTPTLIAQTANFVLAGPTSAGPTAPTFRALVAADIPSSTLTPIWSNLQNAAADLTLANAGFATTFNQTSAVNWTWANTTAATNLGVNQNSPIHSFAGAYFTLGASAADTWTIQNSIATAHISSTVTNITETSGSVVTLAITGGNFAVGDVVTFTGLTTGTWLNNTNQTLTSASATSLAFTDNTSHGTQASHAEVGQVTQANPIAALTFAHSGSTPAQFQAPSGTSTVPTYSFTAQPTFGMYLNGTTLVLTGGGVSSQGVNCQATTVNIGAVGGWFNVVLPTSQSSTTLVRVNSGMGFGWSTATDAGTTTLDAGFTRAAAGIVALGNGSNFDASSTLALKNILGTIGITQLATPSAPTVTVFVGSGSTTWGYKVVAKDQAGNVTVVSAEGTIATQNATLSVTAVNKIAITRVPGAASYDIYRTTVGTSPTTTGKIGTIAIAQVATAAGLFLMDMNSITLSAAANASGGNTVYTGTVTNGGTNNYVGGIFIVTGFVTGANNGTFICVSNTTTTITLANTGGVLETHAGTATLTGDGTTAPTVNTTGIVNSYAGVSTVSQGMPAEYAVIDLTAQTAAIGSTLLYAVPASGQGMYRITWSADITTVGSVSSVLGGTNGFQITATSPTDSVVKTFPRTSTAGINTDATNTTATGISGVITVYAKASTNINYLMDYTSVNANTMTYELHIKLERM